MTRRCSTDRMRFSWIAQRIATQPLDSEPIAAWDRASLGWSCAWASRSSWPASPGSNWSIRIRCSGAWARSGVQGVCPSGCLRSVTGSARKLPRSKEQSLAWTTHVRDIESRIGCGFTNRGLCEQVPFVRAEPALEIGIRPRTFTEGEAGERCTWPQAPRHFSNCGPRVG